jgi:hypothetical protein
MTERRKDTLWLFALFVLLILCYSKVLFTGKIIRAPDIINEFYWGVISAKNLGWHEIFSFVNNLKAGWNTEINSGFTTEGGNSAIHLLIHLKAITFLIPAPACVAWTIVLHFFFGACGVYLYCRAINSSRFASFFAALVFGLSPEMASLINAGHVMKIATIAYAPWAFYCLEKGFLGRRLFWFMATSVVLAIQFFNTHWQIAYYTCLSVGIYGIIRTLGILVSDRERREFTVTRLLGYNLVLLAFFLSTVSMALLPLANWSTETNRGVNSGANQGKGGLDREEAMSWSLPPEETAAFVIPGFFGFSRQESGPNPTNIKSYYWGRMFITQTVSYMGLLPWFLIPLPLIFRRDKYTWLAVIGLAGGVLFSMGKYTPFYNFLYDYFPGISRFRVPKMMMFIPVISLGVLAARGIDLLLNADTRETVAFRRYRTGVTAVPLALLIFLGILQVGKGAWISLFLERLSQPTRYEEGIYLIAQRWNNLLIETGVATVLAALCAGVFSFGFRSKGAVRLVPLVLVLLYVADVRRVNDKFMFLVDAPEQSRFAKTAVMEYIARDSSHYRTLPMDGSDPSHYVTFNIPVMFTSNPVQQMRWQQFLDGFNIFGSMPDIMNVKYLVMPTADYQQQKAALGDKFVPVFTPPDAATVVLENRAVLPKGWLVPSVIVLPDPAQRLAVFQSPEFNPAKMAMVESPPPFPMAGFKTAEPLPQRVRVPVYESERIVLDAETPANSLLVLGEKYYKGWKATVDGKRAEIVPVNHVLRGVYLTPGKHRIEYVFDPLPFKIGKYLTLTSFAFFAGMLICEWRLRRKRVKGEGLP